jgi:hypothetical protein
MAGLERADRAKDSSDAGSHALRRSRSGAASEKLSLDVLYEIFRHLDRRDLVSALLTCRSWNSLAHNDRLWWPYCAEELRDLAAGARCVENAAAAGAARKEGMAKQRLTFLQETARLLADYAQKQLGVHYWETFTDSRFAAHLCHAIARQASEAAQALRQFEVKADDANCGAELDIHELALRRYYEEAQAMLPARSGAADPPGKAGEDSRLGVIVDNGARSLWSRCAGSTCHCHFDDFCRLLLEALPPATNSSRFQLYLRHFLNFPRDNLATTYRFHVLVSLFGPLPDLTRNFERYVLGRGFLGLANLVKAEEVLRRVASRRNTIVIRFSRRMPTLLAFTTYDAGSRRIQHWRNVDENGNPVPVANFLRKWFPDYSLAEIGLDDSGAGVKTVSEYAGLSDDYYKSHF